jgi:hypothetical protein
VSLVEVQLLGLPLEIHRLASEHNDELLREFALLAAQQANPNEHDVPARLLLLGEELQAKYGSFTQGATSDLEAALDRGDTSIDLVFAVPGDVAGAVDELNRILDEADDLCRRGGPLLTLAAPAEVVAYRRWFLEEFIRQVKGEPPMAWPETGAPDNSGTDN